MAKQQGREWDGVSQGATGGVRAQSESIPIAKKSVLRANAPEWKAPVRRNDGVSSRDLQVPPAVTQYASAFPEVTRSTSQPLSPMAKTDLTRSQSSAEERVLAISESRRAWDAVHQRSDDQDTRRVWGTLGVVRERPWNFLEKVDAEEETLQSSPWEFPPLVASSVPIRAPVWPGNLSNVASEDVHKKPPAEEDSAPPVINVSPVRQARKDSSITAGVPSASSFRTPTKDRLAISKENDTVSTLDRLSQERVDPNHPQSTSRDSAPIDENPKGKNDESSAGLLMAATPVVRQEKAVELDPALAQREFQCATLLVESKAAISDVDAVGHSGQGGQKLLDSSEDVFAVETVPAVYLRQDRRRPSTSDFEIIRDIGEGAFGRVMLIERKKTKERFAMKILEKERIVARENQRYVMEERDILTRMEHPFIVSLLFAFQNRNKLYLVMEYLPGGELLKKIRKEGLLNDKQTMFYAGEIVLALEYLHLRNIVHRDLKPENVLLDAEGHIRLTDFGLARKLEGEEAMLKSICGTDLYMAPEMLAGKSYGKAVDFWALGCVLFEMQTGDPPFDAINRKRLYQIIMTKNPRFPSWMTATCTKFLKGLLDRNVEQRLGASRGTMFEVGGVAAIKQHEFFKKLDWTMLERKQLAPPLKPDLDVFDEVALAREESFQDGGGSEGSAEDFRGFSYVHPQFAFSPKPNNIGFLQRSSPAT